MKRILFLFLFSFILNYLNVYAQNESNNIDINPNVYLKQAKIYEKAGDIFSAIDMYKSYNEHISDNEKVHVALAKLFLREKNYKEAKKYLFLAYKNNSVKNIYCLFEYARCLQMLGEYENAKTSFVKFAYEARNDEKLKEEIKLAKNFAEGISHVKHIKDSALKVVIKLLDTTINKPHIDLSPIPYKDNKLIWSSLPETKVNYYDINTDTIPVRKFYIAQRKGDTWNNLGEFDTAINNVFFNTGNGAFSHDKKRFYFSRCAKNKDQEMICKLFVSNLEHNEWQKPTQLPDIINSPKTSNSMPSLGISTANTDVLYFVSNRPEGRGGKDIWFSYWDNKKNEWKEPKNCGKKINTILDEITPYYNVDTKTLYFSSEAMQGLGGFDIYKAIGEGKSFGNATNIGYPLNSSYDDLYFVLENNRQRGFFASNRNGGYSLRHENCCDDIYEFVYSDFIDIKLTGKIFGITDSTFFKSIEKEYISNMVLNVAAIDKSEDVKLLYNYPIDLYMIEPETKKELFVKTDFTTLGYYMFDLQQGMDYFVKVKDVNNKIKKINLSTKPITHSDTIVLDAIIVNTFPSRAFTVKNIYYEFAKANLTPVAKTTIDNTIFNILKAYPNIKIEISSHTDSIGTDESNMILSQDRAQSVVDYLINKGINKERLVAKGYGEKHPIAPNTFPNGKDNEEGRQKNRRTEFKIIGQINEEDEINLE